MVFVLCSALCFVVFLSCHLRIFEMVFERSFKRKCINFKNVLERILLCLWLWTETEALAGLVGTTDTPGVVSYCQGKV